MKHKKNMDGQMGKVILKSRFSMVIKGKEYKEEESFKKYFVTWPKDLLTNIDILDALWKGVYSQKLAVYVS